MNSIALTRTLLIYGLTLPLAVVLGYMLSTPLENNSLMVVGVVAFVLTIPLLIRWYHPILIFSWNTAIVFSFMPGPPTFWMAMAGLGLGFAVFNRILDRQRRESTFCHVPPVTWAIIFFGLVVFTTAQMTGGIGLRSLGGSTYGSKGYFTILAAIFGYFAMTSCPIPLKQTRLYTTLYFLPGLTALMSSLIYYAGPSFYILFAIFPAGEASNLAQADAAGSYITRLGGVSVAGTVIYYYLLSKHGIRGLFTVKKPLRLLCFVLAFGAGLFGGFRSLLLLMLMVFALQFYLEGLLRTTLLPIFVIAGVSCMVLLIPLADRLPLAVQRTVAFLPLELDPTVRYDAKNSTEWRLQMWRVLLPDLHKYVLLGKGYALNPTDLYLTAVSVRRGSMASWEGSLAAGDYHSGPLSIYIPFGSFGVLAFVSFLIASIRTLYQNYQHGDPHLKTINAFLLSMFVARSISFFFVFGSISSDLFHFTGMVGFSVALNGGVKKAPYLQAVKPATAKA